jgi:hypothetical protein
VSVSCCGDIISVPSTVPRETPASFSIPLQSGRPGGENANVTYTLPGDADIRFASGGKTQTFSYHASEQCQSFPGAYSLQGTFTGNLLIDVLIQGEDGNPDNGTVSIIVT